MLKATDSGPTQSNAYISYIVRLSTELEPSIKKEFFAPRSLECLWLWDKSIRKEWERLAPQNLLIYSNPLHAEFILLTVTGIEHPVHNKKENNHRP